MKVLALRPTCPSRKRIPPVTGWRRCSPSASPARCRSRRLRWELAYAFGWSIALTLGMLFAIGALRAIVTVDRWWIAGLEMFGLGVIVAAVAYLGGLVAASFVSAF
jgi:hypothetical protein